MTTPKFFPGHNGEALKIGMVVQTLSNDLWRVTHCFKTTIYVMPVSMPNMVRYAVRPSVRLRSDVESKIKEGIWHLGRMQLPQKFLEYSSVVEADKQTINDYFSAIEPLVIQFDDERNLDRNQFTLLINRRANELEISPVSIRKMVLRYYYFGRNKNALGSLKKGPALLSARMMPDTSEETMDCLPTQKRRGRQPIEAKKLGLNNFVATDSDVLDMVECFEALASKGKTTQIAAHQQYLNTSFAKRHPKKYADYLAKMCPLPVTLRQFRAITNGYASLSKDAAKNVAGHSKKRAKGTLMSTGPAEVYEIDATGGRIFLVDSHPPHEVLGTPLIYLMIDRWSRFIVSVYVTLRPASWEEIRFALLIAFTSRKRRFTNLGINIDEDRWPTGRVCARLVQDRGSEMISKAMLEAAVEGLQIEAETLPPYCPDGKGIIERLNRELKRKMAVRKIKGGFAERPVDVQTKRTFKAAKTAAVHSLREIYWTLIDLVDAHNNKPHKTLEARSILRRARVTPTPKHAYLWGLKNITGIESPPFDDADYQRLLLATDKASIANGAIMYRGRKYLPMNAAAERQARLSTSKRKEVPVKIDRSDPVELYAPNGDSEWPRWQVNSAGLQELQEITIEEEVHLVEAHRLLIAESRNEAFIEQQQRTDRLVAKKRTRNINKNGTATKTERRAAESLEIKQALIGKGTLKSKAEPNSKNLSPVTVNTATKNWEDIEKLDRLQTIERQRKARLK